jgi:hypothetical protein
MSPIRQRILSPPTCMRCSAYTFLSVASGLTVISRPNIPISATKTQVSLPTTPATSGDSLAYIPPHPQNGTPYHRYTTFLLLQSSQVTIDTSKMSREHFDMRTFFEQHGYVSGGGIHMFREEWDKTVGVIYKNILGVCLYTCDDNTFIEENRPTRNQVWPSAATKHLPGRRRTATSQVLNGIATIYFDNMDSHDAISSFEKSS